MRRLDSPSVGGLSLDTATLGLGVILAITMIVTVVARVWLTRIGEASDQDLTLYQIALLAGGPGRVSDTALSYLAWAGMIEVRESTDRLVRVVGVNTVPDLHPVELSVLGTIDAVGVRPEAAIGAGRLAAQREVRGLTGLVIEPLTRLALAGTVVAGCGAVVAGAAWWAASADPNTTGFVPLLALISVLYAGWWLLGGQPRLTGGGLATLESIRSRFDEDLEVAAIGVTSLPVERAMHVIALYGRDALTGGMSALRKVVSGSPAPTVVARSSLGR